MKKLLILMLLASLAFAEFQLQSTDVSVKLNDDGSAIVEERMNLVVYGDYSRQLYESGFNSNTLSSWQAITNISEIKTHIGLKNSDIRGLIIRPQPLQKSLSVSDVWYAQIILDYSAYPFYGKDGRPINDTGVVTIDYYKPRTTRYTLNDNAFNLPRTATGDIILDPQTTLSITPPAAAMITYINPITKELSNARLPVRATTLNWNGLTLVQFSLTYEVEESLDKEVVQFFSDIQQGIRTNLTSAEGIAAMLIAALLAGSYFYLRLSRR